MSDQDSQDKPLFLVVTIKPRLDRLDEAEAQLQSMRQNTLKEPGCVFMHLVQPQDDPDTWVMLEMFRSRAAWDEHMRQPYNTEGNKILEISCASLLFIFILKILLFIFFFYYYILFFLYYYPN